MRGPAAVVVVVGLLPLLAMGACEPPRVEQGEHCAAFVSCYLTPGDDELTGYERLAAADDEDLACYDSFGVGDVAPLLATMRRAYAKDGSCWAGGYDSVTGVDVAAKYEDGCSETCRTEVAAECGRRARGALSACPDDDAVAAACAAFADDPIVDDAVCAAVGAAEGDAP